MIAITIENSTYCGADCLTCVRKQMDNVNQNMSDEFFFSFIDELNEWNEGQVEALSFVGTGDPLMDPGFINKIQYVKEHTNLKIHLTNTAHLLKGALLDAVCNYVDSVKISHYGVNPKSFSKIHGGALVYEQVVQNIDTLLARKDRPWICMTYLLLDENRDEKNAWLDKWEKRCDVVDIWVPHNWAGKYCKSSGTGRQRTCNRPGKDFQIHVDGKVSVCCLDTCGELVIGDLKQLRWKDILQDAPLQRIIKLHEEGLFSECGICGNCDLLYDRTDALIYTSNKNMKVGMKAGYSANKVNFSNEK